MSRQRGGANWAERVCFYALEKLADALYALATGSGRVQERLGDAAIFLIRVRPEDFPTKTCAGSSSE